MNQEAYPDALPAHYRLHWYEFERVLGQGGFGITYLAHDHNLDLQVAIKEYLPTDVAQRRSDASVRPRTQLLEERYRWGLARFIEEARTLARFDHPNIVRVQSVFEANDSAYMVMRFEQGENLGTLLDRRGTLGQDELLRVLLPVLDGLERVHEAGFIHRDIKPENIHIRSDGSPVLLDFGSARYALGRSQSMTVLVAPGYAPLEQYHGDSDTQGPWTDIYGLAATAYRAITGAAPPDAVLRARGRLGSTADTLLPATTVGQGRYSASLLAAIDHGLQLAEADRPQSMAEWRRDLTSNTASVRPLAAPPPPRTQASAPAPVPNPTVLTAAVSAPAPAPAQPAPVPAPAPNGASPAARRMTGMPVMLGAGAIALAGGAWLIWPRSESPAAPPQVSPPAAPAPAASRVPDAQAVPASAPPVDAPPSAPKSVPAAIRPIPPRQRASDAAPAPARAPERSAAASVPPSPSASAAAPPTVASGGETAPPPAINVAAVPAPAPVPVVDPTVAVNDARGRGDNAEAYRLARALADKGNARAMEMLGQMSEEGRGTARNALQAYIWYSLAAQRGQASARAGAERAKRQLQPAEVAQADKTVQNWNQN
jgi:serine/threonine protein kinase